MTSQPTKRDYQHGEDWDIRQRMLDENSQVTQHTIESNKKHADDKAAANRLYATLRIENGMSEDEANAETRRRLSLGDNYDLRAWEEDFGDLDDLAMMWM